MLERFILVRLTAERMANTVVNSTFAAEHDDRDTVYKLHAGLDFLCQSCVSYYTSSMESWTNMGNFNPSSSFLRLLNQFTWEIMHVWCVDRFDIKYARYVSLKIKINKI